ncbi:hypothetical protein QF044_003558 [Chryseobacterium sp. W4I1]|nr:hypothetical protein [Chryseobacterium sp. W4I1]
MIRRYFEKTTEEMPHTARRKSSSSNIQNAPNHIISIGLIDKSANH